MRKIDVSAKKFTTKRLYATIEKWMVCIVLKYFLMVLDISRIASGKPKQQALETQALHLLTHCQQSMSQILTTQFLNLKIGEMFDMLVFITNDE